MSQQSRGIEKEDRSVLYVQLLEHVQVAKATMRDIGALLKDYPNACDADTLLLLTNAAKEMRSGTTELLNKLNLAIH